MITRLLLISQLIWSCQSYKSIEKVTVPSNPNYSRVENISRQLSHLKEGDLISVTMENDVTHELIFKSISRDTLNATFLKPKTEIATKVPLGRIQEIKVERFDLVFTLAVNVALAIAAYFFISSMVWDDSGV